MPSIREKLDTLKRVDLDYIKIGQQATTLSGDEAQRVKLSKELSRRATGQYLKPLLKARAPERLSRTALRAAE